MRFNDRKEFLYDGLLWKRNDVKTAAGIHSEYTRKHAPFPHAKFFEVDRAEQQIDDLWHVPVASRTPYTSRSPMEIPALHQFDKPDWRLTKLGLYAQRNDRVLISNLILQEFDWFPVRGDKMFYNVYRYMVINVVIPPDAYWAQTNFWLGLLLECMIAPEGDAKPGINAEVLSPAEIGSSAKIPDFPKPLPEI